MIYLAGVNIAAPLQALSGTVDEDSQAFLDSLQDITDSNSRSAFSSSQVPFLLLLSLIYYLIDGSEIKCCFI